MSTKVLILSRYGALGPSGRVRMFAYEPWLAARGISVDIQPLLPDRYLQRFYDGGRRDPVDVVRRYCARLVNLCIRQRPDVVWLEKELWPFVPALVEYAVLRRVPYVLDIDDAVFHTYDEHRSTFIRTLLGRKIDHLFRHATLVTAGSSYLAKRAAVAGAAWIERLPTVVDIAGFVPRTKRVGVPLTIGWIGSPPTQRYLKPVVPILTQLLAGTGMRFVTIGARFSDKLFGEHEAQEWREETEIEQLSQLDVGIMPLPNDSWARGKCAYKLIQYMASGVPVIASPVGANNDVVHHGKNGLLAGTLEDWRAALTALVQSSAMREELGAAGRQDVERSYCLQRTAPRVAEWLANVAGGRSPRVAGDA